MVERGDILKLLEQWRTGAASEREVHEQAEVWLQQLEETPDFPEHAPESILMEVLIQLDALNYQLITPEDIPAVRAFLLTPQGSEEQAWSLWRTYWNSLNLAMMFLLFVVLEKGASF